MQLGLVIGWVFLTFLPAPLQVTAIVWVLATQVKNPPFQLLLHDPENYLSLLQHAGGIVMTRYLLHVGFPCLQV